MMANYFTPFSLRISEELLTKIKIIAARNKRSANKEIEFVLEQYVQDLNPGMRKLLLTVICCDQDYGRVSRSAPLFAREAF